MGAALVPILFTYGGWQQTNFIAEEIVAPERTLPRALVGGVLVVVTVYLLANVAYLRVLGLEGLARSSAPAADTMRALLGPAGGTFIAAGIAISTFGFLDLVILVTPRVLQAMAADGVFLPRLAVLHPRYRTPALAIVVESAWAIVLTLTGTFAQLVDYVSFGDWIFFGLTVAGLYRLRARDARDRRHRPPRRLPRAGISVDARHLRVGRGPGRRQLHPGQPPQRGDRHGTPPPRRAGVSLVEAAAGRRRERRGGESHVTLRTVIVSGVMLAACAGQPRPAPSPVRVPVSFQVLGNASPSDTGPPTLRIHGQLVTIRGLGIQVEGGGLYGDVDATEPHTLRLTLYDSLPGRPVADPPPQPALPAGDLRGPDRAARAGVLRCVGRTIRSEGADGGSGARTAADRGGGGAGGRGLGAGKARPVTFGAC